MNRPVTTLPRISCASIFSIVFTLLLVNISWSQTGMDCTGNEAWLPVGNGVSGEAVAATEMEGDLYVLHRAPAPGDDSLYQISRWDGTGWRPVTSLHIGINRRFPPALSIREFIGHAGSFYLGGTFTSINGDSTMKKLARWNGATWQAGRGSLDIETVEEFALHQGELYMACGFHDPIKPDWGMSIVKWEGDDWALVGDPQEPEKLGIIRTLLSWNGDLYLGGEFGRTLSNVILKWDGSRFTPLPLGGLLTGAAYDLFVYDDRLYASGRWYTVEALSIIVWDDTTWRTGVAIDHWASNFMSFTVHDNQFYRVYEDSMRTPGLEGQLKTIIRFDGTRRHLVSNTDGYMSFIMTYKGEIYIGGKFTQSCGTPLSNIARMEKPASTGVDAPLAESAFPVHPNPARETLRIDLPLRQGSSVILRNMLGEVVARKEYQGERGVTLDVRNIAPGTYLLSAETATESITRRVLVVR